ncbi:MAG TPA: hypothetical protein VH593_13215 [Ktedonobacteraceae bacterium]
MARKDSEKDSERPHYYSQFWLDVAAGRRVIGAPRPGEEAEQAETETPEPISSRRAGRSGSSDLEFADEALASSNGQVENIQHPVAEPIEDAETYADMEAEEELPEQDLDYSDTEEVEDEDIPDMDLDVAEENPDEEFYEDEEEDDDLGWGGRGRKKSKPSRVKQPRSTKPPRRERRSF